MTMQLAFVVILWAALAAAAGSFALVGLGQRRRRGRLARAAHASGMLFAAEDPFDSARRYHEFALVGGGHGARAWNVTYGRLGGVAVRAFDFHYEIGHGTRRLTRRYGVVVVETGRELPGLLMWNRREMDYAPLAARTGQWQCGEWSCSGDHEACKTAASGDLGRKAIAIQTRGPMLLACIEGDGSIAYVDSLPEVAALGRALSGGDRQAGSTS